MKAHFSRDSWHHRLNIWVYGLREDFDHISLCPYFWMTVLAVILSPFRGIYNGIIKATTRDGRVKWSRIGYVVFVISWLSFLTYQSLEQNGLRTTLYWIGIIGGIIAIIVGGIVGGFYLLSYIDYNTEYKPRPIIEHKEPKPKQPSLFFSMLKAKIEKICPYIEWGE